MGWVKMLEMEVVQYNRDEKYIDSHTHQPDWLHGFLAVSVFLLLNGFLSSSRFIYFLVYGAVQ